MGVNDNLNRISTTLISERQQKAKEKEQKAVLKELQENFKIELIEILMTTYRNNEPIYTQEARKFYINDIIKTYKNEHKNKYFIDNIFTIKYEKDLKNYLFINYYNIAQKAERIAKKQTEKERKEQKEAEQQAKIEIHNKRIKEQKAAATLQKALQITIVVIKVILYIVFNIFIAALSFLGGFIGAMLNTSTGTRKRR